MNCTSWKRLSRLTVLTCVVIQITNEITSSEYFTGALELNTKAYLAADGLDENGLHLKKR